MGEFHVVEHFVSINGEGKCAGQLAYFIRFAGCNLACDYCDTKWANEPDVSYERYDEKEIYKMIKKAGVKNITLTGGEPLCQKDMGQLLSLLRKDRKLRIEIETNGSVDIKPFIEIREINDEKTDNKIVDAQKKERLTDNVTFTLDYKLPVSGMESRMCLSNYQNIRSIDTVKFVVGSKEDLIRSRDLIETYGLVKKGCGLYFSPCFGKMEPSEIVEFMVEQKMNDVNLQLQLHKFIWDPDKRGV